MGYPGRCKAELRVDEQTIPTVNSGARVELSTDAQKGGPSISSLAVCEMPYEWNGVDYRSKVDEFNPETQSSYSLASIFMEDVRRKQWEPVMRGFVRGVRPTDMMGTAKVYVSSPDQLLTAVPFSASYDRPAVGKVFRDVADTMREETPFSPTVRGVAQRQLPKGGEGSGGNDSGGNDSTPRSAYELQFGSDDESGGGNDSDTPRTSYGLQTDIEESIRDGKVFKRNVNSAADALNWATNSVGGRYYFDFRHEDTRGLSLVYDDGSDVTHFQQRENRGPAQQQQLAKGGSFPDLGPKEVDLIKNEALAEVFPINSLRVKGKTGVSVLGWTVRGPFSDVAPFVTVEYDPFVRRAGGNVVSETIEIGSVTLEAAENVAKNKLEQNIRDSGDGSMEMYGNPYVRPYDLISSVPECSDVLTTSVKPITYSISEVIHEAKATEEYRTHIKVTPRFDPSKLNVVESEMKEV